MTYLGVPLITSALRIANCNRLVEFIARHITHWTSRFLSYARRLQLVISVLFAVQMYWFLLLILPVGVYKKLERLISNFLWSDFSMRTPSLKVPWEVVTRPRKEGGLGIKKLIEWNRAAALKHLWLILSGGKGSIWVEWVRVYLFKGKSVWLASIPTKCLWVWRNLLVLCHLMKKLVSWCMGDGSRISFWLDAWLPCGPLLEALGGGFRQRIGIPLNSYVQEFYAGD